MKKSSLKWLLLLPVLMLALACSDDDSTGPLTPNVELSATKLILPSKENATDRLYITSNMDWTLSGGKEWISYDVKSGGAGTTQVEFVLAANPNAEDRNDILTLTVGSEEYWITIQQKQKDAIVLSQDVLPFDQAGGNFILKLITANVDWKYTMPDWVEMLSFDNIDTYVFNVKSNETPLDRMGYLIFMDGSELVKDTVEIHQVQKNTMILSKTEYTVPNEGLDGLKIQLQTNVIYKDPDMTGLDWVTFRRPATRSWRTDVFYFDIAAQTTINDQARQAVIRIESENDPNLFQILTIDQVPGDVIYVSVETQSIAKEGGEVEFEVQSNVNYVAEIPGRYDWVTDPVQSTKNGITNKITFKIAANLDENLERFANIRLKGEGASTAYYDIVIKQAAARPRLSEIDVLRIFYVAMNGDNWGATAQVGWDAPNMTRPPQGVTVRDGHVVKITAPNMTKVGGGLPAAIGDLEFLEELHLTNSTYTLLNYQKLTQELPEEIGNLVNLKKLSLVTRPGADAVIPRSIGNLRNLEEFYFISECTTIPEEFGELESLKRLTLLMPATDMPATFGNMKELTYLKLGAWSNPCQFNALPESMGDLPKLEELVILGSNSTDVGKSGLAGGLPTVLNWPNLTTLRIENTLLPTINLATLTNLTGTVTLTNNAITTLPDGLDNLTKVDKLYLQNNQISSAFPQSITSMTALTEINLSNNEITGELPNDWENMVLLKNLILENNQIGGVLPESLLGLITELDGNGDPVMVDSGELDANENPIMVPVSGKLKYLRLANNNFTGGIPKFTFHLHGTPYSFTCSLAGNKLGGAGVAISDEFITWRDTYPNTESGYVFLPQQTGFEFTNEADFAVRPK